MTVFWFRRDLRLDDNAALYHALQSGEEVLPIFIFDPEILDQLPKTDARVGFIHELLSKIDATLQSHGRSLAVFHDTAESVFTRLLNEQPLTAVYANHDYEPYARKRDAAVSRLLKEKGVRFKTCKDQVIFEKSEVVKDDGAPYVVYTPYSRKWKQLFAAAPLPRYESNTALDRVALHSYPFLSLEAIGFTPSPIRVPDFTLTEELIDRYADRRNFPAVDGTSGLGPHLRFGSVSVRDIVRKAIASQQETFLNELIWREFFMQILWHFPHTPQKAFRERYDLVPWEENDDHFQKWCEGKTGYPIVDAGMRELNATGRMHNRVRMITASFLCKHLLIDWRRGEAYFAEKLLDYEQASNVGNWQWAAGSGVDAAPYFRIFNPEEQIKKFDSERRYVRKWVPELGTDRYPKPIVDHKEAREKALATYKAAVG